MSVPSKASMRRSSITSNQSLHSNKGTSRAGLSVSKAGLSASSKASGLTAGRHGGARNSPMPGIKGKGGIPGIPEEAAPISHRPRSTETIKFVYSLAVTRAFKRDFHVTQFGPPSAATLRPDHFIEISKLSQLYKDFRHITGLLESNQKYIEKVRQEMEASGELIPNPLKGGSRFPQLSLKNYSKNGARGRSRIAMNSPVSVSRTVSRTPSKLPQIM